jgi:signal transduction histidine kinase/DNA-binding response OmpR family regulator
LNFIPKSICLFHFALFCFLSVFSFGQPNYEHFENDRLRIEYRLWTVDDGLPHWRVRSMFSDSKGYLWILNYDYLSRFDGKSFEVMDTISIGFKRPPITSIAIAEDIEGNIWYNTGESIKVFFPSTRIVKTLESYLNSNLISKAIDRHTKVFSVNKIVHVYSPSSGKIWRFDGQLELVLEGLMQPLESGQMSNPFQFNCLPGPDHKWWFTDGTSIYLLDARGEKLRHFDGVFNNQNVLRYANRQLYVYNVFDSSAVKPVVKSLLSGEYSAHIDGEMQPFVENGNPGTRTFYELPDLNSNLITAPNGELLIYDYLQKTSSDLQRDLNLDLTQKPHFQGLILPPISIGNRVFMLNVPSHAGLLQLEIKRKNFEAFLRSKNIRSLALKDAETLLALTNSGLYEVDLHQNTFKKVRLLGRLSDGTRIESLKPTTVYTRKGKTYLLFKNYKGFVQLDKENRIIETFLEPAPDDLRTRHFLPLSDDEVLYASSKEIVKVNLDNQTKEVLKTFSVSRRVKYLHQDVSGGIWVASPLGLYNLETDSTYAPFLIGKNSQVNHIFESPDGSFWISMVGGLCKWKPFAKTSTMYGKGNGFITDEVYSAFPDSSGRLWLSSNKGLIAFDTASLTSVNYTKADGLVEKDHNSRSYTSGPNGMLYFGTIKGVNAFNPNAIEKRTDLELPDLSLIKVEQLNTSGEPLTEIFPDSKPEVRLNVDQSCIQTVLHLSMPFFKNKELSYAWRVESISPQWTEFNPNQGFTISGMPNGEYQVEVRVSDVANLQFSKTHFFNFNKGYHIYQLFWFRCVALALVACGVFIVMRYRAAKLNQRNRQLEYEVADRTTELREQNETVSTQKKNLERLDAAKSQLFNNISHEFRTPLNIIKGQTELAEQKLGEKHEASNDLKHVRTQVDQLTQMLDEIMNLSKLQMGTLVNSPEAVEWNNFFKRVFAMFDGLARKKQLDFRFEVVPNEPTLVSLDIKKVERILINLIGNAIKFTPEVGRILVRSVFVEKSIMIEITDNGPGIDIEEQKTIFERYQQGQASGNAAQPGYGIGLALCKEYTELIDGKLWVESTLGKGSSFFLEIPFHEVSEKDLPKEGLQNAKEDFDSSTPTQIASASGGHVLIVEDNPDLLAYLIQVLKNYYQVSTATNGQHAWNQLKKDASIDLVLSDVMMPVMDGFTLLQKTRSHAQLGFMPFIVLTALADDDARLKGLRIGVDAYLTKPFDSKELKLRVSNLIARQQKRKASIESFKLKQPSVNMESDEELISYDEAWLMEVEDVVKKNVQDSDFKVPDLAYMLHVSERTLFNKLKSYTGLTPSEYMRKSRLDLAIHFIKARKFATVKELSASVGIANTTHFATMFKKEFGVAPTKMLKA